MATLKVREGERGREGGGEGCEGRSGLLVGERKGKGRWDRGRGKGAPEVGKLSFQIIFLLGAARLCLSALALCLSLLPQ